MRWSITFILIGMGGMVAQTALVRELLGNFGGNELVLGFAFGTWLVGGALGAALGGRLTTDLLFSLLVGAAISCPGALTLVGWGAVMLPEAPGALPSPGQLLLLLVPLLAPAFLAGLLFPVGLRAAGCSLARRYAADGAGALLGGLVTLFLLGTVGNVELGLLATIFFLFAAAIIARGIVRGVMVIVGVGFLWYGAFGMFEMLRGADMERYGQRLETRESPYGRLRLGMQKGQVDIYLDGGLVYSSGENTLAEELVHLPLALVPEPKQVLLLGGTLTPLPREVLKHPVETLTLVELDPQLPDWVFSQLAQAGSAALTDPRRDPRTVWIADDPRAFILRGEHRYDAIILALPGPATAAVNRYYTREFFAAVRERLAPDGAFVLGLPGDENYQSAPQRALLTSIVSALREARLESAIIPLSRLVVCATANRMPAVAPDAVLAQLRRRGIRTVGLDGALPAALIPFKQEQISGLLADPTIPANTDAQPVTYFFANRQWLHRFDPLRDTPVDLAAARRTTLLVALPLALLLLAFARIGPRRPTLARAAAIAIIGFAAMAGQLILLLAYQNAHGSLYRDLGLLTAVFMAGTVIAAVLGERRPRPLNPRRLFIGYGIFFAAVVLPVAVASGPEPAYFATAFLNGLVSGALYLGLARGTERGPTLLYAADLAGALLAAVTVIPFLLPLFSFPVIVLAVAGLLLLTAAAQRKTID